MKHGIDYFTHNAQAFTERLTDDGCIAVAPHELNDLKTRLAQASTVVAFPGCEGIEVTVERDTRKQG